MKRHRCITFSKEGTNDWLSSLRSQWVRKIRHVLQSLMFTDLLTRIISRRFFVFRQNDASTRGTCHGLQKISLLWTLKVLMHFFCFHNIWIPMTTMKMSWKSLSRIILHSFRLYLYFKEFGELVRFRLVFVDKFTGKRCFIATTANVFFSHRFKAKNFGKILNSN